MGLRRLMSDGSSDENCSSGNDSPNWEQLVDYTAMDIPRVHHPPMPTTWQERITSPQVWQRPQDPRASTWTQPMSPSLPGRVRTFSNPNGMGSRSIPCRRSSRLEVQHTSGVHQSNPEGSTQFQSNRSDTRPSNRQRWKWSSTWTDEALNAALAAVDNGTNIQTAATQFGIPYSTFREWCFGIRNTRRRGPPSTLSPTEEQQIVDYLVTMSEMGYGLTPTAFKVKVADITKGRYTPFRNGIPGRGWMRCWNNRHPELTMRVAQALEAARAQGLIAETASSFYNNLELLYKTHNYSPDRIWNCDETGTQAGRNGGAHVIARKGARNVHTVVPDKREWMSILVCVNAAGTSIPSFYIFRGKRFCQNYISNCEPGATMAMQQKAWMTCFLFSTWISHFIRNVQQRGGISPKRRHLLILDGHSSHVNLEVINHAKSIGLDMVTLPSHTSHALQPLDYSVFKPFKGYFRAYRDFWSRRNVGAVPSKQTLAQWGSLGLRKALSEKNIKFGFRGTGILPLDREAVERHLRPSEVYQQTCNTNDTTTVSENVASLAKDTTDVHEDANAIGEAFVERGILPMQMDTSRPSTQNNQSSERLGPSVQDDQCSEELGPSIQDSQSTEQSLGPDEIERQLAEERGPGVEQFFVAFNPTDPNVPEEMVTFDADIAEADSMSGFLTLPSLTPRLVNKQRDPLLDFTKSIMLTSDEYIAAAEEARSAKIEATKEKERLREEKEERKRRRAADQEEERREKEARLTQLAEARAIKAREREEARAQRQEVAAQRASEKARKAAQRVELQRLKVQQAAERARGPEEYEMNDILGTLNVTSPFPYFTSSTQQLRPNESFVTPMYSTLPSIPHATIPYVIAGRHSTLPCPQPLRPQSWTASSTTSIFQGAILNSGHHGTARNTRGVEVEANMPPTDRPGWQADNLQW